MSKQVALLIGCLLLLFGRQLAAQNQTDSLKIATAPDSVKLGLLNDAFWQSAFSDPARALAYARQQLSLAEKLNAPRDIERACNNAGIVYYMQSSYPQALEYYFRSLKINEQIKNAEGQAGCLNNIGLVYRNQGNYPQALTYFHRSRQLSQQAGIRMGIAYALSNIGSVHIRMKQYRQATNHYLSAIKILIELNDTRELASAYDHLGLIFKEQKAYDKAQTQYLRALELFKKNKDNLGICGTLNNLAETYRLTGRPVQARQLATQALALAQKHQLREVIQEGSLVLANISNDMKDYGQAIHYYRLHLEVKDSLYNQQNSTRMAQMNAIYESEVKQARIALLEKNNQIHLDEVQRQRMLRNSFIGAFVFIVLLAIVLSWSIIRARKANRLLALKNQQIKVKNQALLQQKQEIEEQHHNIELQNAVLHQQKKEIEEHNRNIKASITYAKRIQDAMLPDLSLLAESFSDSFVFFRPRDIVSGDFYWFSQKNNKTLLAVADCTGHGVPGAFMSLIASNMLNHIVNHLDITQADRILEEMHTAINQYLHQHDNSNRDGMDISLCVLHHSDPPMLEYAGAHQSLCLFYPDATGIAQLQIIKGTAQSVGGVQESGRQPFARHLFSLEQPVSFYLASDGYSDQFGGPEGKKFTSRRFYQLLEQIQYADMAEQALILENNFLTWKGEKRQLDDILVIGARIR